MTFGLFSFFIFVAVTRVNRITQKKRRKEYSQVDYSRVETSKVQTSGGEESRVE